MNQNTPEHIIDRIARERAKLPIVDHNGQPIDNPETNHMWEAAKRFGQRG